MYTWNMPEFRTKSGGANPNQLEQYIQNIVQNINKNYTWNITEQSPEQNLEEL